MRGVIFGIDRKRPSNKRTRLLQIGRGVRALHAGHARAVVDRELNQRANIA